MVRGHTWGVIVERLSSMRARRRQALLDLSLSRKPPRAAISGDSMTFVRVPRDLQPLTDSEITQMEDGASFSDVRRARLARKPKRDPVRTSFDSVLPGMPPAVKLGP